MKKFVAAASLALVSSSLVLSVPASAEARAGCVTQGEFAKVKKGTPIKKVHRIFGTAGSRDAISRGGGFTFEVRSYKACTQFGAVAVGYQNGRLSSKSAVF